MKFWTKNIISPCLWSLTAVLTLGLFTGCTTNNQGSGLSSVANIPANPNILRVGITPSLPPMVFKSGQNYQGIEVDFAQELAKRMNRTPMFVAMPWEKQVDALLEGKIDIIMSGMTITPARQVRISFSRPYMRSGQVALVRREDLSRLQLFLFSEKYKVGVQTGTTGDYFAQQNLAKAARVNFKNPEKGAKALVKGKIDAFITDSTLSWWLASQYESQGLTVIPRVLTDEVLAWGIRKEDTQTQEAANAFLNQAEQDGTLVAIIRRSIPNFGDNAGLLLIRVPGRTIFWQDYFLAGLFFGRTIFWQDYFLAGLFLAGLFLAGLFFWQDYFWVRPFIGREYFEKGDS